MLKISPAMKSRNRSAENMSLAALWGDRVGDSEATQSGIKGPTQVPVLHKAAPHWRILITFPDCE